MSGGHGFNRSRGRGSGRGSGNSKRSQNNKNADKDKKSGNLDKKKIFEPYYAGKHQADTYDSVKEQIILHIQKNYTDSHRLVTVLRTEDETQGEPSKPTLTKVSYVDGSGNIVSDAAKLRLGLEQEAYNIEFREELRIYNEGEKQFSENKVKAFALILNNYCSKVMKHRIEEKSDYESKVRDKPVELLKLVIWMAG